MNESDFERIVAVDHPDPHAILGPHLDPSGLVVRVFRPGATQVILRPDDAGIKPRVMARLHPAGIFGLKFVEVEQVFPYRIEARSPRGVSSSRDPYAFSPALGDDDFDPAAPKAYLSLAQRLGAFVVRRNGTLGTAFAVWAPGARRVSVVGDFNKWDGRRHAMRRTAFGVWEIFAPEVGPGTIYKFELKTAEGIVLLKSDPLAFAAEVRPSHASKVFQSAHVFKDEPWMERDERSREKFAGVPMSIYEVHLGSFRRVRRADKLQDWSSYRELSAHLVEHVAALGFTHVELLPVMEHPFDGSWGYQVTGYFAPTARFGSPDDLRALVDRFHVRGIGVILDWPPAHFPKDAFALGRFDGTPLYEHADPRRGEHREWNTFVFDYGKSAVRNFLIASALYWIESFHADGLRVDAVASMLYLDYGAQHPSEWEPNEKGGRENLEAVAFLRELTGAVHEVFPGVMICAEESTTWPGVTKSTKEGGLGFDFKWNMGWMHDTLNYFQLDPIYRSKHHKKITFGMMYAYSEQFLLPLSHDEVVHLKKSLLSKMPGDRWKQHANLRALYGYMWAHPGKKLLFMGGEIGQWKEWNHDAELDWSLLTEKDHAGLGLLLHDLNAIYRKYEAFWELDAHPAGFTWINANEEQLSIAAFVRFPKSPDGRDEPCPKQLSNGIFIVCIGNFTPVVRHGYRIGVPRYCRYLEELNTDAVVYGGSGVGNLGAVECEKIPAQGFPQSIVLTLPPLSVIYLIPEASSDPSLLDVAIECDAPRFEVEGDI